MITDLDHKEHEAWNEGMARLYDPDSFITKTSFAIRFVESLRLKRTAAALRAGPSADTLDLSASSWLCGLWD